MGPKRPELGNRWESGRHTIVGLRPFRRDCSSHAANATTPTPQIAAALNGASGAEVKGTTTEAGMFALRERRVHVTQEDFELAVAKVMKKDADKNMSLRQLWK